MTNNLVDKPKQYGYILGIDVDDGLTTYCVFDAENNEVIYSGSDLDDVRKYNYKVIAIDEQDIDLIGANSNVSR